MSDEPAPPTTRRSSTSTAPTIDDPGGTRRRRQSLRKIVIRVLVMAIGIGVAGVLLVPDVRRPRPRRDPRRHRLARRRRAAVADRRHGHPVLVRGSADGVVRPRDARPPRHAGLARADRGRFGRARAVRRAVHLPHVHVVGSVRRLRRRRRLPPPACSTSAPSSSSRRSPASAWSSPTSRSTGCEHDRHRHGDPRRLPRRRGIVLGSEKRTAAAGRLLDRVWRPTMRLLRRRPPDRLARRPAGDPTHRVGGAAARHLAQVAGGDHVRHVRAGGAVRDVASDSSASRSRSLSWVAIFCVWAIVRGLTVDPAHAGWRRRQRGRLRRHADRRSPVRSTSTR